LTTADWARLAEALVLVLCVRIGLHVMSFPELARRLDRRAQSSPNRRDTLSRITWAADAVARRLPGTTCLAEALAARTMLRRHGYDATLRIGARNAASTVLEAHAWVECGGEVVSGRVPEIEDYAVLT
jgi:uncharacterized protein YjeT (DUF2065 family)